ncbi:hypothetical protein ABZ690_34315 [Streptomyces sp. NPDC006967]|uniref:hypothetical protein n=1 Tax=Streptomyces sp. NPDC006967 TaxID=3156906 RepID=UPI0033E9FC48
MPEPTAGTHVSHCTHWIGAKRRRCHTTDQVRPYFTGLCCPAHTPAAVHATHQAQGAASCPTS